MCPVVRAAHPITRTRVRTRKHALTHAHPVTVCKDQKQRHRTAAVATAFKRDGVRSRNRDDGLHMLFTIVPQGTNTGNFARCFLLQHKKNTKISSMVNYLFFSIFDVLQLLICLVNNILQAKKKMYVA